MPKDANGVELAVGDRVIDEIYGPGTVFGTIALEKGVGLNVLVKWDSGHKQRGGRSSEHMKKIEPNLASADALTPHRVAGSIVDSPAPETPARRHSPRLSKYERRLGGASSCNKDGVVME